MRVPPGGPRGRRSGRACRGPLLTGSCRQRAAWGASPPSSAIFNAAPSGPPRCIVFSTLSSNQTGHLAFNQKTRGQIPAGWPLISAQAAQPQRPGTGTPRVRVQVPPRAPHFQDRKLCSEAAGFYPAEHGAAPWRSIFDFGGTGSARFRSRRTRNRRKRKLYPTDHCPPIPLPPAPVPFRL